MTLVVDASVAAKWFVHENLRDEALALLDELDRLHAPDLIVPETANIAWKKCLRGEIGESQAKAIAAAIRHYVPRLHPLVELTERALAMALALRHPVYDCLYLACAEAADGVLVTADRAFCDAVRGSTFENRVRHLDE